MAIDREGLGDMHARAREEYAEARVAEMQNIAETVEDVARAKLLCDNIKWETARVVRKIRRQSSERTHRQGWRTNRAGCQHLGHIS